MTCTHPRCDLPSVGDTPERWFGQCRDHALAHVLPQLASLTAQAEYLQGLGERQLQLVEGM